MSLREIDRRTLLMAGAMGILPRRRPGDLPAAIRNIVEPGAVTGRGPR